MVSIFSFFSGAGFLDLGFESSGYQVAFVNEFHEPFLKTYQHSRNILGIPNPRFGYHKDVTEFISEPKKSELEGYISSLRSENQIIGFIGGPPCPDFSVGGKNRGSEGERGKLTETYVDLICDQQPDFFLLENVKGLWRTKKHKIFYDQMREKLGRANYILTERLINAIEYGVPQQRERIILIGFNKKYLIKSGINIQSHEELSQVFPWEEHIKYPLEEIMANPWSSTDEFTEGNREMPANILEQLTVEHWFKRNRVDKHINKDRYFKPRQALIKFQTIREGDDSKKSFKRLHRWRYSPTAAYGNNEVHLHPYKARRLSVAEALAIQSLPAKYEVPNDVSLTDAFKTVGNGVPYLAAKAIAETILDFIGINIKYAVREAAAALDE
jgi:DNA (cytosine-5)-methyltransferase 1